MTVMFSATCTQMTCHPHECENDRWAHFYAGTFPHTADTQMVVPLPHEVLHEPVVSSSEGTLFHKHHRNEVYGHVVSHGLPVQICEQMYYHNLDTHMDAVLRESVNVWWDDPPLRKIHHIPHRHEGVHLNETWHVLPSDVFEEKFFRILGKQMVDHDYGLLHGSPNDALM